MTPAYFAEVERAFVSHAGRGLILSPMDRERVAGWARAGVPAAVIVDGIARAFDRPDPPRVRGLGFAAPAIEDAIKAWRQARVGRARAEVDPSDALAAAFAALIGAIERAGQAAGPEQVPVLRRAWRAVSDLRTQWTAGAEADPIKAVFEAEQRLLDAVFAELDPAERAGIEDEVAMALDGYSITDELTLRITRQTLRHDALRRRFGLPPLELRL